MDASTSLILAGMNGCPVDLVLYDEGETRLFRTVVERTLPLSLRVEACTAGLRAGRRVMLLAQHDGLAMRADGHLDQVRPEGSHVYLDLSNVHWELLERRRHVRVPVRVPVEMRAVCHTDEAPSVKTFGGTTVDMSLSGAFVRANEHPDEGSLIEFSTEIEGLEIRTLAVVARLTADGSGVGLHFVEYLGNARHLLNGFLAEAA